MELVDEKIHLWLDSARFVKAKSGVYILYDKKLEPLYIGHATNLQDQFSKYLDTNFEDNPCKQKTHSYQRIFTENPKERQKSLLDLAKEKFGRLPSCNSEND